MMLKEITIKLDINEQQEEALRELLPHWQQYENEGKKPFEHYTVEKLLETLLYAGSLHTIWRKIKEDQNRKGLITIEELLDDKYLTVAERIEARKQKEGGAQ